MGIATINNQAHDDERMSMGSPRRLYDPAMASASYDSDGWPNYSTLFVAMVTFDLPCMLYAHNTQHSGQSLDYWTGLDWTGDIETRPGSAILFFSYLFFCMCVVCVCVHMRVLCMYVCVCACVRVYCMCECTYMHFPVS